MDLTWEKKQWSLVCPVARFQPTEWFAFVLVQLRWSYLMTSTDFLLEKLPDEF